MGEDLDPRGGDGGAGHGEGQRARARRELAEARADRDRANEHITLFAGQVSHDLRSPLTAVLANAEMLAGEPAVAESEDAQWMIEAIVRAAHRMDAMIEDLLGYAREGGAPSVGVTSLGAVTDRVLADLAPAVTKAEAEITVDPLPTVPADERQIYDVVLNLLSNAIKFATPGEPPRIRLSAERHRDSWRVKVTDNGIGVPPERRDAMFVLFARADKRVEGSGIGLASAKRIVEAHGGRIGMEEADGGGTTVWFELPG